MENTKLYDLYKNNTSFNVVYYDFKSRHTLNSQQNYLYVCQVAELLSSVSATNLVIGCIISPGLLLPAIILGILKISSAFVFLDKHSSCTSLKNVQNYVPITTLLVEEPLLKNLKKGLCVCWKERNKIVFDNFMPLIIVQSSNCNNSFCPNSRRLYTNFSKCVPKLAYVIQTSGTTGEPKIVQVPHQCIVPNIFDLKQKFDVTAEDALILCSPLTFDPSIVEIFLAVLSGCTLVIVPDQMKSIPQKFVEVIINSKTTILQPTPSLVQSFGDSLIKDVLLGKGSSLRIIAFGGEPCPSVKKLRRWKCEENKTKIFNLYGLTEVSCWASCFEIDLKDKTLSSSIPLGEPLLHTNVQINSDGELCIGGEKRWCVINDEVWKDYASEILRPTGDYAIETSDGALYFDGRKDGIIKFKGQKLSLQRISTVLDAFPRISSHFLKFNHESSKLLLFIVQDLKISHKEEIRQVLVKKLQKAVSNLPIIEVINVPCIPLTKHGKADYKKLLSLTEIQKKIGKTHPSTSDSYYLDIISKLWKRYTNQETLIESDNFILSGGDSILALQFASDIEWELQLQISELVDKLLNNSYKDVCNLIKAHLQGWQNTYSENKSFFTSDHNGLPTEPAPKKVCLPTSTCFEMVSRRGFSLRCCHLKKEACHIKITTSNELEDRELSLKIKCKFDLKKCIDASPCVAYFFESDELLAFIGSHAGLFCCLNVRQETFKWTTYFPDRIESSACLSFCGKYVYVGCYDYKLYCLNIKTGSIQWQFNTSAEVKSSPVVSSQNTVFVGSHDKHLYAIDGKSGELLWKKKVSNGSIFSSPALLEEHGTVVVATLDGVLSVLKMDTGTTIWSYSHGKPLFSSPLFTTSGIFVGAVNDCLLHFNLSGTLMLEYHTSGPVFSSAILISSEKKNRMIFGCHDSTVYCVNTSGVCVWKFCCDSPVYATPFTFQWMQVAYVVIASTAGIVYILNQDDGKVKHSEKCPGEIFSSPTVLNGYLVFGCRDNYVYCFNLSNVN